MLQKRKIFSMQNIPKFNCAINMTNMNKCKASSCAIGSITNEELLKANSATFVLFLSSQEVVMEIHHSHIFTTKDTNNQDNKN